MPSLRKARPSERPDARYAAHRASSAAGARRSIGVVAVAALWLGLTATGGGDASGARPGDSAAWPAPPESMDPTSIARTLPRLSIATGPAGIARGSATQDLHAALTRADGLLAPQPPREDAAADAALASPGSTLNEDGTLAAASPPATSDAERGDAARDALGLAARMTSKALEAPAGQAERLLVSAAAIDDAARASLARLRLKAPADTGVAGGLKRAGLPQDAVGSLSAVAGLKEALQGSTCSAGEANAHTGVDATPPADPSSPISAGPRPAESSADDGPVPVKALAAFPEADVALRDGRADNVYSLAADLSALSFASQVVAQREGSPALLRRANELRDDARGLQASLPEGCAPVIAATAGAWKDYVPQGQAGLAKARLELEPVWRTAAVSVSGQARKPLVAGWWAERSRGR